MTDILDLQAPASVTTPPPADFEFTYSHPAFSRTRRAAIHAIERLTGRPYLERLYHDWSASPAPGENIFAAAIRLMKITVATDFRRWRSIPANGPVLIIANHPYGVLDGLAIGYLATLMRRDVKIMSHSLLCQPREIQPFILPIDFGGTPQAQHTTISSRRQAIDWLKQGHVVVVFPAGGVSTTIGPFGKHAVDGGWHPFIAKLARIEGVAIVPAFVSGQNSRLFQIVSHYSYALRLALLFRESLKLMGATIDIRIGSMVMSDDLPDSDDRKLTMRMLRRMTYELGDPSGPDWRDEFVFPPRISLL